ncbi:MAG: ATP-binding protein, partial [Desulfoferrobacter sp.]
SESMENDLGKRMLKESERIADIVKSLLSFARGGRDDKWPTRIDAVLREALVLTQAQIRKESICLETSLADDLPEIEANFQQIQQVFLNIINNARYALNEKYPSMHKNKVMKINGESVIIEGRAHLRVTFYDRGTGIPADKLSLLTRPFYSTKPFGKGTGLGLSITRRIITDHGGRLTFESVEGEFSKVIVDLPVKGAQ